MHSLTKARRFQLIDGRGRGVELLRQERRSSPAGNLMWSFTRISFHFAIGS